MNAGVPLGGGENVANAGGNNLRNGAGNQNFPGLADPSVRHSILSTLESHHMLNARNDGSIPRN